mgnify:FL=1|jgi:predicted  nucleic acid-binding Zn-ribbon protein
MIWLLQLQMMILITRIMKKIFYFILFTLPFFSFSQSKSDLEKELKIMNEKNEKLEKKVKELTDNVDKLTVKNENKKADKTEAFQKLIKENNEVFFTKLFEENYKKDDTFFKKTGLANENDVNAYKKYNLILDNILADTSKSNEDIELAKRAKKFNSNYIIFFELNDKIKDFFKNKYYKEQADQYLKNLDQLDVSEFETLNNDRVSLKDKILLYEKKSCELKSILDKLKQKAKDNNSALSSIYNNLKKEYPIPYLQEVISKMSKNLDSYNSESLNCNQNEILQK